MTGISTSTYEASVYLTIQKFGYFVVQLGNNATQIFNEVSGLDDGNFYGRYFASGNPLIPYSLVATSVEAMIVRGVALRAALAVSVGNALEVAQSEDIETDLVPAIYAVTEALAACCASPGDQIKLLSILAGFTAPPINSGNDTLGLQIQFLANLTAMQIRISALSSLAAATAAYTPTSSNDAMAVRQQVAGLIDAEMTICASIFDDVDYSALAADRIAVIQDMNARGNMLAPVVTQTFSSNLPSLVIAYRLYQDSTMEPDLVARNNPVNPGFMPMVIEALA